MPQMNGAVGVWKRGCHQLIGRPIALRNRGKSPDGLFFKGLRAQRGARRELGRIRHGGSPGKRAAKGFWGVFCARKIKWDANRRQEGQSRDATRRGENSFAKGASARKEVYGQRELGFFAPLITAWPNFARKKEGCAANETESAVSSGFPLLASAPRSAPTHSRRARANTGHMGWRLPQIARDCVHGATPETKKDELLPSKTARTTNLSQGRRSGNSFRSGRPDEPGSLVARLNFILDPRSEERRVGK